MSLGFKAPAVASTVQVINKKTGEIVSPGWSEPRLESSSNWLLWILAGVALYLVLER